MNKLKRYTKTAVCLLLSAGLAFSDMPFTALAAEGIPETITESEEAAVTESAEEEEVAESLPTEEDVSTEAETISENMTEKQVMTEEQVMTESASAEEEISTEIRMEEQTETEIPSAEGTGTEILAEEETETETEVEEDSENDVNLAFSTADIAHGEYKENGNNITWVIDADGKLTVEGTGDFAPESEKLINRAPWYGKGTDILSAEIKVTGMKNASCMFSGCSNLTSVDVSDFDTSSVTDMSYMFSSCSSLTSVDVSGFDTSSVTDMSLMFYGCSNLTSVDLRGIDTGNVTTMRRMFWNCSSLTSVDVSGFDTSNVTYMEAMFYFCSSLTSVDVSSFDTSSVTDMAGMFNSCSSLTSVDVRGFDTSSVADMGGMFSSCSSLTSLDVSSFDTGSVTDMASMFNGCSSLTSIDVSSFDTSIVKRMDSMFRGCTNLTGVDVSGFNTGSVTSMNEMFRGCSRLTSVDMSGFDTSSVTDMVSMFNGCSNLTSLDLSSFDAGSMMNMYSMEDMFKGCSKLNTIYTPRNVKFESVSIGGATYYDMNGKSYTSLPKDQPESILLYRSGKPELTEHITARKAKTVYACGETPGADGIKEDITVTYYSAAGIVKELAPEDYTTNVSQIDMGTLGEKTLTVAYSPSEGEPLTADIVLTVGYLLEEDSVTITLADADNYVFDNKAKKPTPAVTYKVWETPVLLEKDKDYTVHYKNNKNAYQNSTDADNAAASADNAPAVIIKGCGDYFGTVEKTFEIAKAAAPAEQELVLEIDEKTQSGTVTQNQIAAFFSEYGSITDYEVGTPIEDDAISGNVLAREPSKGRSSISLYYSTNNKTGDFVTIPVTVSFQNYKDAVLNIKIIYVGTTTETKKEAVISGIEIKDSTYNKLPVSYTGTAKVSAEDNTDITNTVKLTYTYSGTQADGSAYAATAAAPTNAGSYKLTVAIASDNADYTGSKEYSFTIAKAPLTITARDMGLKIGADLPKKEDYRYDTAGLLEGDQLTTEPTFTCNIASTNTAGTYDITVSGADAGMNYEITYKNGTLTVSEAGESTNYYTVTFSLSGHGSDITNTGVKEGSLLEKPQNPQADGYTFTGWYIDQSCTVLWDFAKDTVASDTILYAGWTKNGTSGGDNGDDSPYDDSERINLSSVSGTISNIKAKVYDQNAYEPVVKVTVTEGKKKITLTEGADYSVTYQNNTNAGEGKVIITGNGIYKGQIEKTFTISPKPVKKLKVLTSAIVGTAQTASSAVYVYDGTKRLTENVDYELSNIQPVKNKTDIVQVTVKGKSNYDGEVITKITVYESGTDLSKLITPDNVTLAPENSAKSAAKADQSEYAYTGKAVKPAVKVIIDGTELTNKDYKVQYQNNKDAGTAYVVVTGKGAYKGKAVIPFTIKAETVANANDFSIKAIKDATYNGKLQKPAVKVTIQKNGKTKNLSKKDYIVTYENNFHAGTATVTVTGKGNYAGLSATKTFNINPQQIKKASLKGVKNALTLTYNKRTLKEGTDYEPPVYGQENKNKVSVTIKGKGDFTGEMTKTVKTQ